MYDLTKPVGGQYPDVPYYLSHLEAIGGRVLMLLSGPGEATGALARIGAHLVPGGRVFLDVDAPHLQSKRDDTRPPRRVVHGPDGATIVLDRVTSHDMAEAIDHHVLFYEKWKDGELVAREVQDFPLRRYEQDELTLLLREAGFGSIAVCGDYVDGAAPATAKAWRCFSAQLTPRAPSSPRRRTASAGR